MALENITSGAASTIADLDPASPAGGEDVGQADDHIRNIKKALQLTYPNISETVSGVASELAFAHKGGTVSGAAIVKGDITGQGRLDVSGTVSLGGPVNASTLALSGGLYVKGTFSVSATAVMQSVANFHNSASFSRTAKMKRLQAQTMFVSATISGSIVESNYARSAQFAVSASAWGGAQKYVGSATPTAAVGGNGDIFFVYQ